MCAPHHCCVRRHDGVLVPPQGRALATFPDALFRQVRQLERQVEPRQPPVFSSSPTETQTGAQCHQRVFVGASDRDSLTNSSSASAGRAKCTVASSPTAKSSLRGSFRPLEAPTKTMSSCQRRRASAWYWARRGALSTSTRRRGRTSSTGTSSPPTSSLMTGAGP